MHLEFEIGPIRPPSEAASLLLRLTRNCPWNKCTFCRTFKGKKFSLRSVAEIKKDIDTVAEICSLVRRISWTKGRGGAVDEEVLRYIYHNRNFHVYYVAAWMYAGGKTVFLQDANSLAMKTADLVEVLCYLKERLPSVERITSYARSTTVLRKSAEELRKLREAGLSRLHIGMESGCDEVLHFVEKGATAQQQVEAGRKVKEAGISLSEYVILGLGGQRWTVNHALETATALNAINPDFIRLRTLAVGKGTPLHEKLLAGEFEELPEEDVVREERVLIENLSGITSTVVSDHSLNLLEEVNGRLPEDKPAMLSVIDRFLALPLKEKRNFIAGKRLGYYRKLSDLLDADRHDLVGGILSRLEQSGRFREVMAGLKEQLIVN